MQAVITTQVNRTKLVMLNVFHTTSWETNPEGSIAKRENHTPNTQKRLISCDDFLFAMRTIRGTFHNGNTIAAINPIFIII